MQDHARVRRIDSDLVFPGKNPTRPAELKKPWHDALTAAQIADFRFHDLRHCTASYLAMNGATLAEIADILGHRTLSMVKRYTHIADSHSAKVVEAMNQKVFSHG
jgi:integrase